MVDRRHYMEYRGSRQPIPRHRDLLSFVLQFCLVFLDVHYYCMYSGSVLDRILCEPVHLVQAMNPADGVVVIQRDAVAVRQVVAILSGKLVVATTTILDHQ